MVRFRRVRLYLHAFAFYIVIDSYIYRETYILPPKIPIVFRDADYWNTPKCLLHFIESFNNFSNFKWENLIFISISYTNKLLFCMRKGAQFLTYCYINTFTKCYDRDPFKLPLIVLNAITPSVPNTKPYTEFFRNRLT